VELDFKQDDWVGPEDLTQDIGSLRKILKDLTQIQGQDGKIFLDKLLKARYDGIMAGIAMAPLPNLDAALAQEYAKGRAVECLYQMELVNGLIATYKETIDELQHRLNEENDYDGQE